MANSALPSPGPPAGREVPGDGAGTDVSVSGDGSTAALVVGDWDVGSTDGVAGLPPSGVGEQEDISSAAIASPAICSRVLRTALVTLRF